MAMEGDYEMHYAIITYLRYKAMCFQQELNSGPLNLQASAWPTEARGYCLCKKGVDLQIWDYFPAALSTGAVHNL